MYTFTNPSNENKLRYSINLMNTGFIQNILINENQYTLSCKESGPIVKFEKNVTMNACFLFTWQRANMNLFDFSGATLPCLMCCRLKHIHKLLFSPFSYQTHPQFCVWIRLRKYTIMISKLNFLLDLKARWGKIVIMYDKTKIIILNFQRSFPIDLLCG